MGWNDRIENNPYEPYPDYTAQDHYEAWMHYQAMCAQDNGLTSQNINPADFAPPKPTNPQPRQGILSRLWVALFNKAPNPEKTNDFDKDRTTIQEMPF